VIRDVVNLPYGLSGFQNEEHEIGQIPNVHELHHLPTVTDHAKPAGAYVPYQRGKEFVVAFSVHRDGTHVDEPSHPRTDGFFEDIPCSIHIDGDATTPSLVPHSAGEMDDRLVILHRSRQGERVGDVAPRDRHPAYKALRLAREQKRGDGVSAFDETSRHRLSDETGCARYENSHMTISP
jgi:hypothetical protein